MEEQFEKAAIQYCHGKHLTASVASGIASILLITLGVFANKVTNDVEKKSVYTRVLRWSSFGIGIILAAFSVISFLMKGNLALCALTNNIA